MRGSSRAARSASRLASTRDARREDVGLIDQARTEISAARRSVQRQHRWRCSLPPLGSLTALHTGSLATNPGAPHPQGEGTTAHRIRLPSRAPLYLGISTQALPRLHPVAIRATGPYVRPSPPSLMSLLSWLFCASATDTDAPPTCGHPARQALLLLISYSTLIMGLHVHVLPQLARLALQQGGA